MTINEFNNEEVLFMYFTNKIDLDSYQHVVDTRTVIDIMDIIGLTEIKITEKLNDQDIDEILQTDHYKYCVAVHEKLHPIVELIEEVNPDLYTKVQESFNKILI